MTKALHLQDPFEGLGLFLLKMDAELLELDFLILKAQLATTLSTIGDFGKPEKPLK